MRGMGKAKLGISIRLSILLMKATKNHIQEKCRE
jgi:hypothetical protein